MPWQWIILAVCIIIVSYLSSWYLDREHKRHSGEELGRFTSNEIIGVILILLWIAVFIGRWSASW